MPPELSVDIEEARSALAGAALRTRELFISVVDPTLAVRRSEWAVGEVGAHLAIALRGFTEAVRGEFGTIAPYLPPRGVFADRLSAVTAGTLAEETERDPQALGPLVAERVRDFLATTATLPGSQHIATPWYGDGASLSLATATALLAGEQLLHGYDVAATLGTPWPISTSEAILVIRAVTSMMPLAVDPAAVAGMAMSYGVQVRRGGPRFVVRVGDDAVTIESDRSQPVDCRLSADPLPLLLVSYGRIGQWRPILRGQLRAGGRRPWLAFRFANLFFNP